MNGGVGKLTLLKITIQGERIFPGVLGFEEAGNWQKMGFSIRVCVGSVPIAMEPFIGPKQCQGQGA